MLERLLTLLLIYSLVVVSVSVVEGMVVAAISSKTSVDVVSPCLLNCAFEQPYVVSSLDQTPLDLCHNLSNFDKCLFRTVSCFVSLTLSMNLTLSWK